MNRHEIEIEDLSQGGRRVRNRKNIFQSNVCNLFLPGISLLEAYELQGERLHKYEGPGFNVKKLPEFRST